VPLSRPPWGVEENRKMAKKKAKKKGSKKKGSKKKGR
jgi:hypothetical protein